MGLNPIEASKNITEKYLRYIKTTFFIKNRAFRDLFEKELTPENFSKGPYLDFIGSFKHRETLRELIDSGILNKGFLKLFKNQPSRLNMQLYLHQQKAIHKAVREDNDLVISTGTGSGKTESFLYPIFNHLLEEKVNGTLCPGVRALLIYPMNALANDQIKRLRTLLKDYPDITFGAYTGETEYKKDDAEEAFKSLNENQPILDNEILSRDEMKESPPNILITNYAMLEYLMLRPADNIFFNGQYAKYWKYVVLDEAHTYNGATGIEVSMLLRRLKHLLEDNQKIRFFLTSATLGTEEEKDQIVEFATNLCADEPFSEENVIMAERQELHETGREKQYPSNVYKELVAGINNKANLEAIKEIVKTYDGEFSSQATEINHFLYDFLIQDRFYYVLRDLFKRDSMEIREISKVAYISEEVIVNFVFLASKAEKNESKLLDARYHMFLKSLEGVYVTFGDKKRLSVFPEEKVNVDGEEIRYFKISVCKYCGQIYLSGLINEEGYFEQKKENEYKGKNNFYMVLEDREELNLENDEDFQWDKKKNTQLFTLCTKCGKAENSRAINGNMCNCDKKYHKQVLEIVPEKKIIHSCYSCGTILPKANILRQFYLGQEAAASVIASSLYEEIPSQREYVETKPIIIPKGFLGDVEDKYITKEQKGIEKLSKQLLVFSDSRQQAAYFNSYFDVTYNNLLRRRLLIETVKKLTEGNPKLVTDGIDMETLFETLSLVLVQNEIVNNKQSKKEAWKTILYEISSRDRNSLENLGLLSFQVNPYIPDAGKIIDDFLEEDALTIQRVLAESFKKYCILDFPLRGEMQPDDRKYYLFSEYETSMTLEGSDSKSCMSWLPKRGSNSRVDYIKKTRENKSEKEINGFLEGIWKYVFEPQNYIVSSSHDLQKYKMDIRKFKAFPSLNGEIQWYRCDKCGRLTANNINNVCPTFNCKGTLKKYDPHEEMKDNHYKNLYQSMQISKMKIKEHTAQLSTKTAKEYQEQFIKKEINVLSCSTTFEMGVDVGELETVFMKNMPPTPANYIQRAGRSGRKKDSAAYALTYCRLSSHDLTYFNKPKEMINGIITAPKFKIQNKKIIKRHVNAAIIAAFWKKYPELFDRVGTFFEEENFNKLMDFIEHMESDLLSYIHSFVPETERAQIEGWIEELKSENSLLVKERESYLTEIDELETDRKIRFEKRLRVDKIDQYIRKMENQNLLTFLSRKNIIPKYGFPVDTVELITTFYNLDKNYIQSSRLSLQRDLMIAVSEYAPGSEVIADGKIYRSQYIKRPPKQDEIWDSYDFGLCTNGKCGNLNIRRHNTGTKKFKECPICGSKVRYINTFIIPQYGFIISPVIEDAQTKKPEKTYIGEIHYLGDKSELRETKEAKAFRFGNYSVKLQSTSDDELVIINTSDFYVCHKCGYAEADKEKKHNGDPFIEVPNKDMHKTPYGRDCDNKKLYRRTLGHKFKTDVAIITVNDWLDRDKALSILYALLEGVSKFLNIERNDISGTIKYNKISSGDWETRFVLFDTVPGGAGHVRRIGESDENLFKKMLEISLSIVEQCTCGKNSDGDTACYNCLCNYYNQKYHDILKRSYAIDFLKSLLQYKVKIPMQMK